MPHATRVRALRHRDDDRVAKARNEVMPVVKALTTDATCRIRRARRAILLNVAPVQLRSERYRSLHSGSDLGIAGL